MTHTHLMLDIETLGTRPGAVVMSAALVRFSDLASCSVNLSIPDQQALGLEIDPATHQWWGTQPREAWDAATLNPTPLSAALDYLSRWIAWANQPAYDEIYIWCHGASFDAPLIGEVYRRAGLPAPWPFYMIRDTRTLYQLADVDPKLFATGKAHVALDDAIAQTKAATEALRILARAHAVPA